jgi:heme exporter protein D
MRTVRPLYFNVWLVLGVLACMAISVVISIQASRNVIAQNRAQERRAAQHAAEQQARQRAEALSIVCNVITAQAAVYDQAQTPVGAEAARAWRVLASTYHC